MRITECSIGDDLVLRLQGRITELDGNLLERTVDNLARAGRRRIVLDLNEVSLMDAAGLGALAGACRASQRHVTTLRLAHVPKRIRTLIAVVGLTSVLPTFDSVEDAFGDGPSGGPLVSPGSCARPKNMSVTRVVTQPATAGIWS